MTTHTRIVNHLAAAPVEVDRGDGLMEWEQRCSRCGRLLRTSMSILKCHDVGDVIQRGESEDETGKIVRVQWSAIPMSVDRVGGRPVPNCEAK